MFRKSLAPLALLLFSTAAHAGDKPLYAPAPDWVTPTPPLDASKLTDADPMILVLDQQQRLENGRVWGYSDAVMRIATTQMLTQAGTIQVPWDPAKGDLTIHRLEIIRGTEHIDLIAAGQKFTVLHREQQLEQASINGQLTAMLAVEGLRVGDVLRFSASITRSDPALHGNLQTLAPMISVPAPLRYGRVRLLWPKTLDLRWRSYAGDAAPAPVDRPDGYREVSYIMPLAKPAEMPDDAPLRYRPLPLLEATSYADWQSVSKDMAPLFATQGTIMPNGPIAAEVAKIAKASSDPRTRAALALQLVQDKIRYLFRGMDNGDYVPQKPEQTWSLRYGDCKAKTLLLLAILRELGVEAEPVLANLGLGDLVRTRLSAPLAFNHVLVHARIDGQDLWLDGTGGGARLADIGDTPPLVSVLPIRPEGATLMPVTMHPDARPQQDADIELDASAGIAFPMTYKARVTLRGAPAEAMRILLARNDKDVIQQSVDVLMTSYFGQNEAINPKLSYDEASGTVLVTANGVTYSDWSKENGRYRDLLDKTVNDMSFTPDRARQSWRDIPVAAGTAEDKHMRMRIRLPLGGKDFTLEGDKNLTARLGLTRFSRTASIDNGWIVIDERATSGLDEVAPADIPAMRTQIAQAKARLLKAVAPADYPASFRQVTAARAAKAFDPVFAVYASQIAAAKPDDAHGYTTRAWFNDMLYDRKAVVADLGKAIEIDPDVDNYLWRARTRYDLGDVKGSLADADAALAIDPGSAEAIRLRAIYQAETGKRDEAIAAMAERAAEGGKEQSAYVSTQADLLADGGNVDEGLALLNGEIARLPGNPSLLNSRCWMKGTHNVQLDTALKDCTKSIELSDNPSAALDSRGMVYFRMGRFDDALADFEGALELSPDSASSLFMRGVIGRKTGAAGAADDLAAARLISPRVDAQYADWGIKP